MLFSSFIFLFIFLPIVLLVNRKLPLRASNVFLFISSIFFYFVGEGLLTILIAISILWNYVFGLLIYRTKEIVLYKKIIAAICISGNLSLLIFYKYSAFFIDSTGLSVLLSSESYKDIVLPIGISFFTFQGMSYVVDIYRNPEAVERSPIKLGLFISFFPQLIAGPIIKYNEISEYLSNRSIFIDQSIEGLFRFIKGLAKKVIIANNLAIISDNAFNSDYEILPTPIAWIGLIAYSLQIYYDFSGYSDMAIGLGRIMGFKIPENFNYPYIATSIKEFWRRWHISLSTWFKEYLYIPLGGNRKGNKRTILNLLIVFFITGLWHGASYNFIVWGLFHGVFLIFERININGIIRIHRIIKHSYALLIVMSAWVFFRTENMTAAISYFESLFRFSPDGDYSPILYFTKYNILILILGILFALPVSKQYIVEKLRGVPIVRYSYFFLLFLYTITEISIATHSPFIYFKF